MDDESPDNIALFDLDGTLCDYNTRIIDDMDKLKSPDDPDYRPPYRGVPDYVWNRFNLITSSAEWWASLPRFQLGWDVLRIAEELKYRIMILTQGPRRNPDGWSGKKRWIDEHLGPDVDVTMTRDKGTVYGKVLVDDFPDYIQRWLKWRERGLVIMPAQEYNRGFEHQNLIRYDGSNLEQVREAMSVARGREFREPLRI